MKIKICFYIMIAALFAAQSAQAGTKEELIRVQNELATLQGKFVELKESQDERLSGMHSLLNQLLDTVVKSNNNLTRRVDAAINDRSEDARSQDKSLLMELRELSQKIEDVGIRVSTLAQQFNDYKLQAAMRAEPSPSGVSAGSMFSQAMRDYQQGDFEMAIDGFTTFIENYPEGEQAAKAYLTIGDSYSSLKDLKSAVKAFTRVINDYPQASVVPTALYKRAKHESALQEPENAIADFRDILERFPNAPEAGLARAEIQLLENAQKPKPANKVTIPPARKTGR